MTFLIREPEPTEDYMILGITGSGKSEFLKFLIEQYNKQGHTIIVYDAEKEHDQFSSWTPQDKLYMGQVVRYVPSKPADRMEFDEVCRWIYGRRNIIFCIESIDFYAPIRKDLTPFFKKLVHWGRKRGHTLIMVTRRTAKVDKDACAFITHWIIFRTYISNDVKWLRETIGDDAEKAKTLQKHHYLYWSFGTCEICTPILL